MAYSTGAGLIIAKLQRGQGGRCRAKSAPENSTPFHMKHRLAVSVAGASTGAGTGAGAEAGNAAASFLVARSAR